MKLLYLFAAAAFVAQATEPTVFYLPFGNWVACQGQMPGAVTLPASCAGYVPGTEAYLVLIRSNNPHATAFRLHMTATLQSGAVVEKQQVVERADNAAGFTYVYPEAFGGILRDMRIVTDELGPVGGVIQAARAGR